MDQPASFDEIWAVIEQMHSRAPILDLKGAANGAEDALRLIAIVVHAAMTAVIK